MRSVDTDDNCACEEEEETHADMKRVNSTNRILSMALRKAVGVMQHYTTKTNLKGSRHPPPQSSYSLTVHFNK